MEPSSTGSKDVMNNVSSKAHAAVDSIAASTQEATTKVRPAIDSMANAAHMGLDKAASKVATAAEWASDKGEQFSASHKQLMKDTCNYVSANPLKTVGIAVVAGIVLSRLFS